jgi:hypothetical protein
MPVNPEIPKETEIVTTAPSTDAKTKPEAAVKSNEPVKKPVMEKTKVGEYTIVDQDDPEAGKVTVKGDTVETEDMIINSNRIIIKKNPNMKFPNASSMPPPLPPNLKGLSPEERQKLRELLQKQRELQKQHIKEALEKQKEMQWRKQPQHPPQPKPSPSN